MNEQLVDELELFPSLRVLGQQIDDLAERDARRNVRLGRRLQNLPRVARGAAALGLAVGVATGGAYAVPATRAAVDDVYSSLSNWVSGREHAAPGRALAKGDHVDAWVRAQEGDKRVLAKAAGDTFIAIREGEKLTLGVSGTATTGSMADLRRWLSGDRIPIAVPGRFVANGRHERRALFGFVPTSVARIQFNYRDGRQPVSKGGLNGAFGIVIETRRRPSSITGYNRAGKLITRRRLTTDQRDPALRHGNVLWGDFRYCPGVGGCTPWRK